MEQVHKEIDSESSQGFQPSINSEVEAEVFFPEVIKKLEVGVSPLETECGSTVPEGSDSTGPGFAEAILDEDQTDLHLNAALRSKKYSKITDAQRRAFIDAVENNGEKIIHAAKRFNINYSSAKSILNVFKNEGRSLKKLTRQRSPKDSDHDDKVDANSQKSFGSVFMQNQTPKVTNEISTQTESEEEPHQDNSLLALRDRLLAFKTEKRQNPYSHLITHEATRYPENLKEFPQQQMANSTLSSYISLQGTSGSQNSIGGGETKYFAGNQSMLNLPNPSNFGQQQQYISGIQAQYYQHQPSSSLYFGNQLGLSQSQEPRNPLPLNMGHSQTAWSRAQSQEPSDNNFASMSFTGTNQAQFNITQAGDNQKGQVHYVQPIMYVLPSNANQLNFGSSIYQNIQNYAPNQNTYSYYGQGQNQNQEEHQN